MQKGKQFLAFILSSNILLDQKAAILQVSITNLYQIIKSSENHRILADTYFCISECYRALYNIEEQKNVLEKDFDSEVTDAFQQCFLLKQIKALNASLEFDFICLDKHETVDYTETMNKCVTMSKLCDQLTDIKTKTAWLEKTCGFETMLYDRILPTKRP